MKVVASILVALAASTMGMQAPEIDLDDPEAAMAILQGLWDQTDVNGDGALSLSEFNSAAFKLGITADIFTSHGQNFTVLFMDLDSNATDGGLVPMDLASAAINYPEYQSSLIAAFTNGAGQVPTDMSAFTPSQSVAQATAVVTVEVTVAGKPSDIYPGQRAAIKEAFAARAGVTTDEVIITFLLKTSDDRRKLYTKTASGKRKLTTEETIIMAKIFVPDANQAELAKAQIPDTAADMAALPAFEGLVVAEVETFTTPEWDVPYGTVGAVGGILIVLGVFTCLFAKCCASRNLKASGEPYTGCCDTGCCSFFAVKMWAFSEFVALAIFAGCLFFLFNRMNGLTGVFLNLVNIFIDLTESTVDFIQDFTTQVPSNIMDAINQYQHLVKLLPFATLGPGALALVFMLIAALCPCGKCNKGGYCVTKCSIMLGNLVLIVALIFYSIFAAVSLALKFAPPMVKDNLNLLTSTCEVVPAMVNQLVADNQNALDQLATTGTNVTELQAVLSDVIGLASTVDDGCDNILQLFVEFNYLFEPGVLCVVAILFAMYVNNALCCAAGCCSRNRRAEDDYGKKGVEFTSTATMSSTQAGGFMAP